MIYSTQTVAVNQGLAPGAPHLSRHQVWQGLVMKARNASEFVSAITRCVVLEEYADGLLREADAMGDTFRERITFYPERAVVFNRLSGEADGLIVNEIHGDGQEMRVRFTFALQLKAFETGSPGEADVAQKMAPTYVKAIEATLAATRALVLQGRLA